jgi:hypothetical protein
MPRNTPPRETPRPSGGSAPRERKKGEHEHERHGPDAGWRAAEGIEYEEEPDERIVEDEPAAIDERRLRATRPARAAKRRGRPDPAGHDRRPPGP